MNSIFSLLIGFGSFFTAYAAVTWMDSIAVTGVGPEHPIPPWYSILVPICGAVAALVPGYLVARTTQNRPLLLACVVGFVGPITTGLLFDLKSYEYSGGVAASLIAIQVFLPSAVAMTLYSLAGGALGVLHSNHSLQRTALTGRR